MGGMLLLIRGRRAGADEFSSRNSRFQRNEHREDGRTLMQREAITARWAGGNNRVEFNSRGVSFNATRATFHVRSRTVALAAAVVGDDRGHSSQDGTSRRASTICAHLQKPGKAKGWGTPWPERKKSY